MRITTRKLGLANSHPESFLMVRELSLFLAAMKQLQVIFAENIWQLFWSFVRRTFGGECKSFTNQQILREKQLRSEREMFSSVGAIESRWCNCSTRWFDMLTMIGTSDKKPLQQSVQVFYCGKILANCWFHGGYIKMKKHSNKYPRLWKL